MTFHFTPRITNIKKGAKIRKSKTAGKRNGTKPLSSPDNKVNLTLHYFKSFNIESPVKGDKIALKKIINKNK